MKLPPFLFLLTLLLGSFLQLEGGEPLWRIEEVDAPSLASNVLGDPSHVSVGIRLPESYGEDQRRYPVLYFLSGYSCGPGYLKYVGDVLARPESRKSAGECIVVVVHGENRLGGAFYENSAGTGDWETFVADTLVRYVDQRFRTLPKRESRAITGLSMGGYGALNLAMRHPEKYSVCYAMSPGVFDENGLAGCQMFKNGGTSKEVLALMKRLDALPEDEARRAYFEYAAACKDEDVLFTLAYATTYSPAPGRAPYFKYPYSIDAGGRLVRDDEIWKNFEAGYGNFRARVRENAENLRRYTSVTVNCGYSDEYAWIVDGALYLQRLLTDARLPHAMVWHSGTHVGRFEQEFVGGLLPVATRALAGE